MGHLSRRADSAAHQELFQIYIATNISPCKMSQALPSGFSLLKAPSVQICPLAGAETGSKQFGEGIYEAELSLKLQWEKGFEILMKAQNANSYPHLPALV